MFRAAIVDKFNKIINVVLLPDDGDRRFELADNAQIGIGDEYNMLLAKPVEKAADKVSEMIQGEIMWRDMELSSTDNLALLPDYPYKENLLKYRQELRDYPQSDNIKNGERPILISKREVV